MLELKGITKIFNKGTASEVTALRDINLTVQRGEFITIIGSNGSGKSTLLNVVAGVHEADAGVVRIDGQDVTQLPEYLRGRFVARVHQDPLGGTAPSMTIEENLAVACIRGRSPTLGFAAGKTRRLRFREALRRLGIGLDARLTDRVRNLSGGERQALALVIATLVEPKLVLLDEHCANLDPHMAEVVMCMTETITRTNGTTTLMVTHNIPQALKYGGRMLMMHRGCIVEDIGDDRKSGLTLAAVLGRFASSLNGGGFDDIATL